MTSDAKRRLLQFLEEKTFEPVLRAKPDGYPESKRRELDHVQKATRAEIERFRRYGSASEVVLNFKRDLCSAKAKKVHRELEELNLPTIEQCRDEFLRLAQEFNVK